MKNSILGDYNQLKTCFKVCQATYLAETYLGDNFAVLKTGKVLKSSDLIKLQKNLIVECDDRVVVATSSATHGVYWNWRSGKLNLSTKEYELISMYDKDTIAYDDLSISRYLHDDANLSPLSTIYRGISRIPGGCIAFFSKVGQAPSLHSFLADSNNQHLVNFEKILFYDAIDTVTKRLVDEASGQPIYLLLSGGIDGSLLLAALARKGAKIIAVYGDDGAYQHRINETLIKELRERYPSIDITYQYAKVDDLDKDTLRVYQLERLKWMVKGNYLKQNYKLALADFLISQEKTKVVFAVNGYGIDELYMGGKGDASISSIYLPTIAKLIETVNSIGVFSRFYLDLYWVLWRIRKAIGMDDRNQAKRLAIKLSDAGKSGGKLGDKGDHSAEIFSRALERDAYDIADLLINSMSGVSSKKDLSRFIKLFSYYFVEQNHLLRFYNHGESMGIPYSLPYASVEVRNALSTYHPGLSEMWRPKKLLHSYLMDQCGIDYEAILKRSGARKLGLRPMFFKALRRLFLSPIRTFLKMRKKNADITDDIFDTPGFFLDVREVLPRSESVKKVIDALAKLDDGAYIETISRDMENGRVSRRYSTKEVYNYAHLLVYLSNIQDSANH